MRLPHAIREMGYHLLGNARVRIPSGINRGRRWSVLTLGRGYGTGSFGRDRLAALAAVTRPGDTFWDAGAHKGYVTLAAARLVGPAGHVVAVEPSEENLRVLRRHVAWNRVPNVTVLPLALSDRHGEAAFGGRGDSLAFRLGHGPDTVPVRTLSELVTERSAPAPRVLKLDVEGAEAAVLRGMGPLLGGDQALLIATHGREPFLECRQLLEARGFRIFDSAAIALRLRSGAPWSSDHDLLAIGATRQADVDAIRRLRLIAGP